ncbi:MAG: hypothetical protein AAGJ81_05220 [Verrucomicrobiota bacterium]
MGRRHLRFVSVVVCLSAFLGSGSLVLVEASDLRTFTNNNGQTIRASIESVDGDSVEIRREDGQRFTIPIISLSKKDQEFIADWASSQVLANEREFKITARRKDESETRSTRGGVIIEEKDGFYEVEIENRTGQNLENLKIRWAMRVERTAYYETQDRKSDEWVKGTFEIKELVDREEIVLESDRVPLRETRLQAGYVWASGAPAQARDKLDGFYLAVVVNGNPVREFGLPSGILEEGRKELRLDRK